MEIVYFRTSAELRRWFERHHETARELWVGYYRKGSGRQSIDWPQSVDEALCVGWIDGVRKRVDEYSYTNRFTPRRPRSVWSAVNIARARALIDEGRMHPAGMRAFEARRENRSGIYSYEQRPPQLEAPYDALMRKSKAAWTFYQAQTPSYRRTAAWWVLSAKREETRLARLRQLIEMSARGERIGPAAPPTKAKREAR
jgi:uncharacterized protein YdeI (YjbR/CyaY-like superfamily)